MSRTARNLVCAHLVISGFAGELPNAHASNPLEYPDNGSAAFSRAGAWLAVANEPIATHYNPAALATQASSFSVEQQLNVNRVCYDRRGPDGAAEGPAPGLEYLAVCNRRSAFPTTIPSISVSWRAARRFGVGFAIVPPATYGIAARALPATQPGVNRAVEDCLAAGRSAETCGSDSPYQPVPAPYRYQVLEQRSTLLFPTVGAGIELLPTFRLGAAFISGVAVINTTTASVTQASEQTPRDQASLDSFGTLRTKDLFVPGVVFSMHWSLTGHVDVAAWGRWLDAVRSTRGELVAVTGPYTSDLSGLRASCVATDSRCDDSGSSNAVENRFGDETFSRFRFPYPPEVRTAIRYHLPRTGGSAALELPTRDPLRDDRFDIELDASYALNSRANTIEVRFAEEDGRGASPVKPTGFVPPNVDRYNGYRDSVGLRLGGQYNVVAAKFGVRAGAWVESRSQDPRWLQVGVVGALRGGFGGGVVFRQNFIDISLGYQRHWSLGLDNGGNGAMRSVVGSNSFDLNDEPEGVSAADRTEFRTFHTVNNGWVSQSAHAFTLGGTLRF